MTRQALSLARKVLLAAMLAAVIGSLVILVVLPRATHGRALTVLTGSMTPTIPVGSVVLVEPVDTRTLHVGDVATYQGGTPQAPDFVTHRIVKIDTATRPATFTFKGDANRGPDIKPVPATAIRGKVWFHVPYLGAVRDAMHTKGGLAGIAMLLLAGYALYQGASAARGRRNSRPTTLNRSAGHYSVLMTLRKDMVEGLSPEGVGRAYGGTVLQSDDETFTLLIDEVYRARDVLELIDALEAHVPASNAELATA